MGRIKKQMSFGQHLAKKEQEARSRLSNTIYSHIGKDINILDQIIEDLYASLNDDRLAIQIAKNKIVYDLLLKAIDYKRDILLKINDFISERGEADSDIDREGRAKEFLSLLLAGEDYE